MPSASTDDLRKCAERMFFAAISRADPAKSLAAAFGTHPVPSGGKRFVLGVGKAAVPMVRQAMVDLPDIEDALVVTNPENACDLDGATVIVGAHPVPEEASYSAGRAVLAFLDRAQDDDQVIVLVSGGGSSLMTAPADNISLADYARVNTTLLASGLDINDMNLIRQQIDDLKGGGLLDAADPAKVYGYILSDVIGDDLRVIASGPTVAPIGTPDEAVDVLKSALLWDSVPSSVKSYLLAFRPGFRPMPATNHLIGSNRDSLRAMMEAAPEGYQTRIVNDHLTGDVVAAASLIVAEAQKATGPTALIFGGETTVQLKGNGLGGRNQELALHVAQQAQHRLSPGWVFLSGGTDGRDGPTDAAGGLVDADTVTRIANAGGDLNALLANNDSYAALALAGDLLITGGTGTNVADVQVLICPDPGLVV